MRILSITLLAIYLMVATECCYAQETKNEAYNKVIRYINNKEFKKAIAECDKLTEVNPRPVWGNFLRAWAFYLDGQYDKAISDCDIIINNVKNPDPTVFRLRGDAHFAIKDYKSAIQDYELAMKINPKIDKTNEGIAAAYSSLGLEQWKSYLESKDKESIEKSIYYYTKAIEIEPTSSRYDSRGSCYSEKENYNLALQDFDNALNLNPNNAAAFCGKAIIYEKKGEPQTAIYNYKKAIELNPKETYYYFFVGHLYLKLDDIDSAIYYLNKTIELGNESGEAYHARGVAYLFKKAYRQAQDDLSVAKKLGALSDDALKEARQRLEAETERENIQSRIDELEYKSRVMDTMGQVMSNMQVDQRQREIIRYQAEQQTRYNRLQPISATAPIKTTTHISPDGTGGYYTDEGHYMSDGMGGWYAPDGKHQMSDGMGGWYK